jgi:L-ascorbate metabolism protein UlaG (beta-lactamase superfamily)
MNTAKLLQPENSAADSVQATWMGTAGLYVTDGDTGFYIDPFVSRYGLFRVGLGFSLPPRHELIRQWAAMTGGKTAAAVLISHSHYDHAMDAPFFARAAEAPVYGSKSTAQVARGAGLPEHQIRVIRDREKISMGKFTATFIKSIHSPALFGKIPWQGEIQQPIVPPDSASAYREGGTFAILIDHPKGSMLHYGNPGIKPGIFARITADVLFLSIGGRKDTPSLIESVVAPLKAKIVIPIHFDDLFGPLDKNVSPLIGVRMNEFWKTMAAHPDLTVNTLPIGEPVDIFS